MCRETGGGALRLVEDSLFRGLTPRYPAGSRATRQSRDPAAARPGRHANNASIDACITLIIVTPHDDLPWADGSRASSIAERTAADLARRICEGDIDPGTLLTEVEVAAERGVSRTPVREAMLALRRWGLVRLAPKKGAVVTVPTVRERRDLLAVRGMLETGAVAALDDDGAAALASVLEANLAGQAAALDDARAFAQWDYAFHIEIIRNDDNAVLAQIARELGPRLFRLTRLAAGSARPATLHAEHIALADAVRRRDTASFRALIDTHLHTGHDGYEVAP